jgi:hypothetical protein
MRGASLPKPERANVEVEHADSSSSTEEFVPKEKEKDFPSLSSPSSRPTPSIPPLPTVIFSPGPSAPTYRTQIAQLLNLNEEQKAKFFGDLDEYLKHFLAIAEAELPKIPEPEVPLGNIVKGTLAGGAAAYGTSFLVANFVGKYLSIVNPTAGAMMILAAGPMHAWLSEHVAGSIRANWGTPAAVDARIWANFVTANSMLIEAKIAGNREDETYWH